MIEVQWFYWTQELLVPVEKFTVNMRWWCSNSQPLDYKPSALAIELYRSKCFCWEGVEFILLVYCIIIYLWFLNCDWLLIREVQWFYWTQELLVPDCDWLLIREVQWFYWTQELLVPAEKFTVRMPMVRAELATPGLQTQCSSHWAIQLKMFLLGRSWVYPVSVLHHYIFIISQLWLTSNLRSTVVLLVTLTPGTSREIYSEDAMVMLELATPRLQTQCSGHWAIQLKIFLLGRSWVYPVGVLHHYIFMISQLWLTSHPRSTVVLLDTGTLGTSRKIYSEDVDGETRTRNPWITNPVL